jgi:TRAP-type C4-dicarboxylate transport system substrate-binding protein
MEHPILTQLQGEDLIRELRDSKRIIEQRTGGECMLFAYPNGNLDDFSPSIVEQVRLASYQFAFTVMGRLAGPHDDPLLLDRIYVPCMHSAVHFEARVSGFHGMLKRLLIS